MGLRNTIYEEDFHAWCLDQVSHLKSKEIEKLDWENLIEEISSMGASERQELENRLTVLFSHLLKWIYQKDYRSNSWKQTISEQRRRVVKKMKKHPSLKNYVNTSLEDCYEYAVFAAVRQTNLSMEIFPKQMPFSLDQALDEEWFPE